MTDTPAIRTDITPSTPINWELRGGRLFVETESGDMENVFEDKGQRVTRDEATSILEKHFDFDASDVFTPEYFDSLRAQLSEEPSLDEYESLVGDLVDRAATIPGIDAKHTTVSDEGMVWTSTQNYQRKGVALVVLKNIDQDLYRTRDPEVLARLSDRLPAALQTASDRAESGGEESLRGLMKVMEAIGGADSHALLKVLYAGAGGQIPLRSRFYAGIEAELIFLPERLLPTPIGEERTIREIEPVWYRGTVSPGDGARLDVKMPPELLEMMEQVVAELNDDRLDPNREDVTKSTLFRLACQILGDIEDTVRIDEEVSLEFKAATDGELVGTTVHLDPDAYGAIYDYAENHPDAREQGIVRILLSAITAALAHQYDVETWTPAETFVKDEDELYAAIQDAELLRDVDLPNGS